jgi:hypothetical protein
MPANALHFTPVRLHVTSKEYERHAGPWPEEEGVRLSVLIAPTTGLITGIWTDSGQAELFSFTDDTGHNLLKRGGGSTSVGVGTDHRSALFEISGITPPAPNASRISASGHILISTALGKQAFRSPSIPLKKSAKGKVAGFEFQINSAEPSEYGERGLEVELARATTGKLLREVGGVWFEDASGNQLQVNELGSMSMGTDDDFEVKDRYLFPEQIKTIVIVVELWTERVETTVKYDVSCTIGCGV